MNNLTKRSFYSFLTLYLLSSFVFLSLASYWFYSAQLSTQMSENYYKMNHIADKISSKIINAHMMKKEFKLESFTSEKIPLFDENRVLKYGSSIQKVEFSKEYYMQNKISTLISKRSQNHLGISYIVVQSRECSSNIVKLKNTILFVTIIVGVIIIFISVILSYIFLKPLKEKMQEIEDFVRDTTHELNTPISALMMSTSRIKSKKVYDEKIITNISISSKQLYEMYSSLTFLTFDTASEEEELVEFDSVVKNSIEFFNELMRKKNITLELSIAPCTLTIAPSKAKMLINNLLSNAIKYSPPNRKIYIQTTQKSLKVVDEGIGIEKEKLQDIFKRFTRANSYAGGFGVGLSIVDKIVKDGGYKIEIDSVVNKGTTIFIVFNS